MPLRTKRLLDSSEAALLLASMLAGCAVLWVGIPVGWLWIGSQIESFSSLGAGIAVTMTGAILSIVALSMGLARINRRHAELQERRGRGAGAGSALETMLVATAAVVAVAFGIWFFLFAGTSPAPVNISF